MLVGVWSLERLPMSTAPSHTRIPQSPSRTSRSVSNRRPEEKTLVPDNAATFQSARIHPFGPSNLRQNRERETQRAMMKRARCGGYLATIEDATRMKPPPLILNVDCPI